MMKKGLARVSVFMMSVAIAASVAACTPQDKKGGAKSPTETTVQVKVSREKTKKEKTKNPGKKEEENVRIEVPTKEAEAPKQAVKGSGAGPAKGPGIQETAPMAPAGNGVVKPSAEPSKGQTGEKAPKASEGVKEQDTKKDEKKSAINKKKENEKKTKLSQRKSDSGLKKKVAEKKSDETQARNSGNGEADQKGKPAA